jgi:hypothetical protein
MIYEILKTKVALIFTARVAAARGAAPRLGPRDDLTTTVLGLYANG